MTLPARLWHVAWEAPRLPGSPPSEQHRNFTRAETAGAQVRMIRLLEAHGIGRLLGVWTVPVEWAVMDPDLLPVSEAAAEHYDALTTAWENTDG